MPLDLAHRHAAGIQAQDLVVEAVEPRLALGDELRFETAGAVARYGNLDLAVLGQDRLAAAPVAAIARSAAGRIAPLDGDFWRSKSNEQNQGFPTARN